METFNIEPVFPTETLHANGSSFLKLPLVTNDIGNTPGKEGPPFARCRGIFYRRLSHAHIKELAPTFCPKGVGAIEKAVEVVLISQNCAGCSGEEGVVMEMRN